MAGGETLFDIWMKQESDTIQNLSKAYGERMCMEQTLVKAYASTDKALTYIHYTPNILSTILSAMMVKLARMFALETIDRNLAWFISSGLISLQNGKKFPDVLREAVMELAPQALNLVDSFAIPEHLIQAPIAHNWTLYNADDNQGEMLKARL